MAKRFADSQITRENFREDDSDDENTSGNGNTASASVMSRRKIAMPKRKIAASLTTGQFKKTALPQQGAPNSPFSITKPAQSIQTETKDDKSTNRLAKLKALNLQLKDKILKSLEKDCCADLTPIFKKYINYICSLNDSNSGEGNSEEKVENKTVEKAEQIEVDSSSDDEEEKKPVKIEGPQFTLNTKPTTSDSVFTFGAKKSAPTDDEDSDSDSVEIKGPQFNFTGKVTSDIFKLSKPPTQEASRDEKASEKEKMLNEIGQKKKHAFSFGNSQLGGKPSFNFGATAQPQTQKETKSFSFGSSDPSTSQEKKDIKPLFSFAAPTSDDKKENKPAFSFTSTTQPLQNDKIDIKPSFSFPPSTEIDKTEAKPIASLNGSQLSQENKKNDKATFSFSLPKQSEKKTVDEKPTFSFGKVESESTNKGSDSSAFNSSSNTQKADSDNKPMFSFGITSPQSNNKDEKKPLLNFGGTNGTTTPSFTFGKPDTKDGSDDKASSGFKFSLPFAQKSAESKEVESKNGTQTTDNNSNEEQTESNEQEASSTINLQNGEEDETPLFVQRSKLMIFNSETKAYDSRGVGEMKLLQKKDDKSKVRFLCRSDGMGNILLNTNLVKSFTYAPLTETNENLVKIPVVESAGKLTTYVVKFKQKSDGRQFVKSIEDAKKDM